MVLRGEMDFSQAGNLSMNARQKITGINTGTFLYLFIKIHFNKVNKANGSYYYL